MRGRVTDDGREPVLPVDLLSLTGVSTRIEAVVDSGFTGRLSLPLAMVEAFGLPLVGSAESVLADGSVVREDVCAARVLWHGRELPVRALVSGTTPLIGMALLSGSELRIRAEGDGEIVVEELPS